MPGPKLPKPPKSFKKAEQAKTSTTLATTVAATTLIFPLNFWQLLKKLFTKPAEFFSSAAKEAEYWSILKKYIIFTIAIQLLLFLVGLYGDLREGGIIIVLSFLLLILSVGASFIMPFINAGIIHLGVIIFRGKQGYFNTFKPATYSMFISASYSILIALIFEIINIFWPIPAVIESLWEIAPLIIIGAVIGIIGLVHTIYTQIIGLNIYQQLSKGKAFLAIIIIPAIILAFVMLILILFGILITGLV